MNLNLGHDFILKFIKKVQSRFYSTLLTLSLIKYSVILESLKRNLFNFTYWVLRNENDSKGTQEYFF